MIDWLERKLKRNLRKYRASYGIPETPFTRPVRVVRKFWTYRGAKKFAERGKRNWGTYTDTWRV